MRAAGLRMAAIVTALIALPFSSSAANRIDAQRPDAPLLAAYGQHAIGVRTLQLVNADQIDVLSIEPKQKAPAKLPRYDRSLPVEVWYPAKPGQSGDTTLQVYLRDATTQVALEGRAMRNLVPADGKYPLVVVSHGYPGNRYLMSHLAENLASKGYVVASIDHTDSTYRTRAAFDSTLVNRPLDQLFVLQQMANLAADDTSFLHALVDASNAGLIGFSMGGYGAMITAGAGLTEAAVNSDFAAPFDLLSMHQMGSATHNDLPDHRFKTIVAFGPWGMNYDLWDAASLQGVNIPLLFIAGSQDDVSGYETGTRAIWQGATNTARSLLTFDNANHNAGAPIPAPRESFRFDADLGFNVSEHYTDAVWSNERMNNVSQHFVTAWLGKHLKSDAMMDRYLQLVERSNDGVWAEGQDGKRDTTHTYWEGFPNRSAKGLRFESARPEGQRNK